MAKKKATNPVTARLKKNKTRKETRYKEAKPPGGGNLPAGIEAGVAKLTRLDFPLYKSGPYEGQPMLYYHGVCVQPDEIETEQGTVKTKGLLVQPRNIPLCDTTNWEGNPVSFDDNFAKAENQLKLLGVPTEDIDDDTFTEDVEEYCKTEDIYFAFRTWSRDPTKENPNPRVNVVVTGVLEDFDPGDDDDDGVEDDTEEKPDEEEAPEDDEESEAEEPDEDDDAEDEPEGPTPKQLKAMGKKADGGDEDVQQELSDLAESLGIDPEDDQYDDWSSVAAAVTEAQEAGDDDGEAGPPEVGDVFNYKPPRSRKEYECEVTSVNAQKETVTLTCEDNGKEYKNVAWDKLVEV